MTPDTESHRAQVRRTYAALAVQEGPSAPCCQPLPGGSCCAETRQSPYTVEELAALPTGADLGLGSGTPVRHAQLHHGERVADLGAGPGIDAFLAAAAVGPEGAVIGIDMTPQMVARARGTAATAGVRNVEFRLGEIEHLPLESESVDVVLSNCVINLAADKSLVFGEALRVLRPGGRAVISDIVQERPLTAEEATGGCVATALLRQEYLEAVARAGFVELQLLTDEPWQRDGGGVVASAITFVAHKPLHPTPGPSGGQAYFSQVAAEWDHLREGFYDEAIRGILLERLSITPGTTAVDIGAGTGFLTQELLRRGASVIAVDSSAQMLEQLQANLPGQPQLRTVCCDGATLPLPESTTDVVVACMYLHHAEDPQAAIDQMVRLLRPGGRLGLLDLAEHRHQFLHSEHHDRWPGFAVRDLTDWLAAAGLQEVEVVPISHCCATSCDGTTSAQVQILRATGRKPPMDQATAAGSPVHAPPTGIDGDLVHVRAVPPLPPEEAVALLRARLATHVDAWDLHEDLARGVEGLVVLDVRQPAAFAAGHLPSARSLPYRSIEAASVAALPVGALCVVYCDGAFCNASTKAAERLSALGVLVKELQGGVEGWLREGYTLEREATSDPSP